MLSHRVLRLPFSYRKPHLSTHHVACDSVCCSPECPGRLSLRLFVLCPTCSPIREVWFEFLIQRVLHFFHFCVLKRQVRSIHRYISGFAPSPSTTGLSPTYLSSKPLPLGLEKLARLHPVATSLSNCPQITAQVLYTEINWQMRPGTSYAASWPALWNVPLFQQTHFAYKKSRVTSLQPFPS